MNSLKQHSGVRIIFPYSHFSALRFARISDGSAGVVGRFVEKETVGCTASLDDVDYVALSRGLA
jgi:hypothetical protein